MDSKTLNDKYKFFWGGPLSNFWECPNEIPFKGHLFKTSEHLFMYLKALEFDDTEIAEEILRAPDPKTAKKLGRKVHGFNDSRWDWVKRDRMKLAITLKIMSNPEFKDYLLGFHGKTFVEASPYDRIWGIGMSSDDSNLGNLDAWGQNLLGQILTDLRDSLEYPYTWESWRNELVWCPSQCEYYFHDSHGHPWCIYLRWRHRDPWQSYLVPVSFGQEFLDFFDWIPLRTSKEYKDHEIEELEKEIIQIAKRTANDTKRLV